ncbi:hypothetical protein ABC382_00555 [Lysinibacillus sp. 1P01SD]|uniref:hypothetical protein n=1 Tax=Lysinibacillus sp. 1P01SD TaxID=3132285 RepID=UPI0039A34A15
MIKEFVGSFIEKIENTPPPIGSLDGMWTYNIDGEDTGWKNPLLSTKKDAIRIGKKEALKLGRKNFSIAQTTTRLIDEIEFDCSSLIVEYRGNVNKIIGNVAIDYLKDVSSDDYEKLQKIIKNAFEKWLAQNKLKPPFYNLQDVETISI